MSIKIESQTHCTPIDVESIQVDRVAPVCLTPDFVSFNQSSICWNISMVMTTECREFFWKDYSLSPSQDGKFRIDSFTYQIVFDDGSNIREADI